MCFDKGNVSAWWSSFGHLASWRSVFCFLKTGESTIVLVVSCRRFEAARLLQLPPVSVVFACVWMAVKMSGQSLALQSLTATYTDSEGEDEVEDGNEKSPNDSIHSNASAIPTPPKPPSLVPPAILSQMAPLVSYHDDTVVSDEEGAGGEGGDLERRRSSAGMDTEHSEEVHLPIEPTGRCSNELQDKINNFYEQMKTKGLDMNSVIQQRKDFRNPSIYEKLIQFCNINELGTNYPAHIYDPLRWGKESYYEELARVQKAEMDRREKEKKEKTKVEFVSGTAKRPGSGSGAEDEAKKRKSKWDQVGTMSANMSSGFQQKPAGLLQQTSLTSNVTGTKGTVISAFGSLPRKRL